MASLIKTSGGKVPSRAVQFVNAAGERKPFASASVASNRPARSSKTSSGCWRARRLGRH